MRSLGVATVAVCLSVLASSTIALAQPREANKALLQQGLAAMKQGEFRTACASFAKLAARTEDFTSGVTPHAAQASSVRPEAVMNEARSFAATAPERACTEAYVAALLALGANDAPATRTYASDAALYARKGGVTPSAPVAQQAVAQHAVARAGGAGGAPPVGQYGCSSAPAVLAGSGAYGAMLHQLGQWQGDIWVLDGHRYAGPYHKDDVGTYRMQGDRLVALSGSYAPPRNDTEIVYAPPAGDHAAALYVAFLDHGKPLIGLWCVHK